MEMESMYDVIYPLRQQLKIKFSQKLSCLHQDLYKE